MAAKAPKEKPVMTFRLKAGVGRHVERDGEVFVHGDGKLIETTEDLRIKYPHKWERLHPEEVSRIKKVMEKRASAKSKIKAGPDEGEPGADVGGDEKDDNEDQEDPIPEESAAMYNPGMGEDVSEQFLKEGSNLKVFKKGREFAVFEADEVNDDDAKPLNKMRLRSKKEVNEFIASISE